MARTGSGSGTSFSYAQLEGLWINAGGSRITAPIAAAVAEAESSGNAGVTSSNPDGGTNVGLWQLDTPGGKGAGFSVQQLQDPATNARVAVKGSSDGKDWSAWATFVSGAYRHFLNNSTTPDMNVPGSGGKGGKGGTGGGASAQTGGQAAGAGVSSSTDCAFGVGWNLLGGPVGIGANIASGIIPGFGAVGAVSGGGQMCLITKSELRGMAGVALWGVSLIIGLAGLAVLTAAAGMAVAPPLGKAAQGVGGVLMLVPGGEAAGAAISKGGSVAQSPAKAGRARYRDMVKSDAERERKLGQPKANPDLETRGGAVRESTAQRGQRRRREQGAARARARRAAGQGRPASREDAGF